MPTPEIAYTQIAQLVQRFKSLSASRRKGMNELELQLQHQKAGAAK